MKRSNGIFFHERRGVVFVETLALTNVGNDLRNRFGYARFSVHLEKLIQNARERVKEKRKEEEGKERRKKKEKKRRRDEIQMKCLTPSKSIYPRYQTANGYCENDDCKRKRGRGKKKRKNLDGLVTATLRRKR